LCYNKPMTSENYKLEGELLPIMKYPEPVLSQVAREVTEFNQELELMVKNMLYTMYHAPGIGLAAPQIGQSLRVFVLDVDYERDEVTTADGKEDYRLSGFNPMVFINPVITGTSGSTTFEEGCLSVPGVYEEVKRFKTIHVKYQNLKGEFQEIEADELLSICIQHENDHLDGIVFIERLSNLKKNFYKKKLVKEKGR
jgi:peptide deformylase